MQWKFSGPPLLFRASAGCSKIRNMKGIFKTVKIFRATLFFRASPSCWKILNYKKYVFNTVKIFRDTLFFRTSASCSKILNVKSIFNTVKNFRATLFFRASASCWKILNDKLYIQYSEFRATLFFRTSVSYSKSWMWKVHSIQWKMSGQLCFSGYRSPSLMNQCRGFLWCRNLCRVSRRRNPMLRFGVLPSVAVACE